MKPPPFAYVAPESFEECTELLAHYGDDAKIIAGGQSLMPLLNLRMVRPAVLIDIARIPGLESWRRENGGVCIGALVRQRSLERDRALMALLPLMPEAVPFIGHPATRTRGTVVGSMCHADPAAELPVCAILLGATFLLRSKSGDRMVSAQDFFVDALTTATREDEFVQEIRIPAALPKDGYCFLEIARRHGDFALVSVACLARADADGFFDETAVALGGVGPRANSFRFGDFSSRIGLTKQSAAEFASHIADQLDPESDMQATAEYRRSIASHLIEEALWTATRRVQTRR